MNHGTGTMKIKFDLYNTYIAAIKNSIGTKMFQNLYITENGKKVDAAGGGEFACATFASSVLVITDNLIDKTHATVEKTLKDMQKNDWYKIEEPREGAVLIWAPWAKSDRWHIGFYIGNEKAISNDGTDTKTPQEHHWTYGKKNGKPARKVVSIWWNDRLRH